jgi:hypothetical protein
VNDTQPRRILVERPSEIVILAARHLDSTEGIGRAGHMLTASDVGAINTVLRYVARAHNGPDYSGEQQ